MNPQNNMISGSRVFRAYCQNPVVRSMTRNLTNSMVLLGQEPPQQQQVSSGTTEEQMVRLRANPYYSKYSEKIDKLQVTNPDRFAELLKKLTGETSVEPEETKPDDAERSEEAAVVAAAEKPAEKTAEKSEQTEAKDEEKRTGLDAIVKLSLFKDLDAKKITTLWAAYYRNKDAVYASIPAGTYTAIKAVCETFPLFVYPLPRQDGYEMFIGQFANDVFHFTSLHNYKKLQEFAPDQLTLTHYTELAAAKDVVLMSGLVGAGEQLTVEDAQMLCYLVQHFAMQHPKLMQEFNRFPDTFSVQKVVDAIDMGTLLEQKNKKN